MKSLAPSIIYSGGWGDLDILVYSFKIKKIQEVFSMNRELLIVSGEYTACVKVSVFVGQGRKKWWLD